jgi:hypothetical protein
MTLEVSTSKRQDSLESIDLKFLRELLQTHPQYNQHKWDTKSAADFLTKPKDRVTQRQTERRRCFEKLIGKLVQRDIPGKELVEEYLRNQYRRNKFGSIREGYQVYRSIFRAFGRKNDSKVYSLQR